MPRSAFMSSSVTDITNKAVRFVHNVSWIDWVISVLLVAAIILVAVWVCKHADNQESSVISSEPFACGASSHGEDVETFTSTSGGGPIVVESVDHMKNGVKENEIGCCLVFFERCGHCQAFKPTWKKACNELHGTVVNNKRIVMYESGDVHDQSVWQSVSEWLGIGGYPTILVKEGGKDKQWREYNGSREQIGAYLKSLA